MRRLGTALVAWLFTVSSCFAWGPKGHRVIADVARDQLDAKSRHRIVQLLGNDDLASISTWADEIRRAHPETLPWHFVNIPWDASGFDEARDCYRANQRRFAADHHNCVVDRIEIVARRLADTSLSKDERVEALKFLVHFVADVNQPLHATGRARGGNDIHVAQFGQSECGSRACDLHGTWDIGLIEHARLSDREYVEKLKALIAREKLASGNLASPADWANESFRIAHQVWLNDGDAVDEAYYGRNIQVLDRQLALAGLRLASLLNAALGR